MEEIERQVLQPLCDKTNILNADNKENQNNYPQKNHEKIMKIRQRYYQKHDSVGSLFSGQKRKYKLLFKENYNPKQEILNQGLNKQLAFSSKEPVSEPKTQETIQQSEIKNNSQVKWGISILSIFGFMILLYKLSPFK